MLSSLYLDAFLRQIKTCSHSTCAPLILSGAMIWLYSIFGWPDSRVCASPRACADP